MAQATHRDIYSPHFLSMVNFPNSLPDRMLYVISALGPMSALVARTRTTSVPTATSSGTVTA